VSLVGVAVLRGLPAGATPVRHVGDGNRLVRRGVLLRRPGCPPLGKLRVLSSASLRQRASHRPPQDRRPSDTRERSVSATLCPGSALRQQTEQRPSEVLLWATLYDFGVITGMAQAPDPLCRKDFGGNADGSITRRS